MPRKSGSSNSAGNKRAIENNVPSHVPPLKKKYVPIVEEKPVLAWVPPSVALSTRDKAHQLHLSEDQMTCFGCEGGYRMIRATHGCHDGSYYWEALILESQGPDAHIRLGWSLRQGELQGPVGFDKFSFAYRDVNGASVHASVRNDGYGQVFGPGDVIGCLITINDQDPRLNQIRFFHNGVDQGIAFEGESIASGVYFPAISMYRQAVVHVNFGPTFIIRHDFQGSCNPVSEVQPMSPDDRKAHQMRIGKVRDCLQSSNPLTSLSQFLLPPRTENFVTGQESFSQST